MNTVGFIEIVVLVAESISRVHLLVSAESSIVDTDNRMNASQKWRNEKNDDKVMALLAKFQHIWNFVKRSYKANTVHRDDLKIPFCHFRQGLDATSSHSTK